MATKERQIANMAKYVATQLERGHTNDRGIKAKSCKSLAKQAGEVATWVAEQIAVRGLTSCNGDERGSVNADVSTPAPCCCARAVEQASQTANR
jgi:hypothetical protein